MLMWTGVDRYYFASQVSEAGKVPSDFSGPAHGDVYWKIANGELGGDRWDVRFFANSEGGGTQWEGTD